MKRSFIALLGTGLLLLSVGAGYSQNPQSESEREVTRTTLAVAFVANKKTRVNLTGTPLSPRVTGWAEVEYKDNEARIKLKVEKLDNPQILGPFYTTYIVWAVTPEGQAKNLIDLPSGYAAEVQTRVSAQTLGLIITAEPHNAVRIPSPKLVAETTLPKNVPYGTQTRQAEFISDRGKLYEPSDTGTGAIKPDYTTPLLVLGARRSLDIALRAGAKEYAGEEWQQAQNKLTELEQLWPRNMKKPNLYSGLARDVMRLGQVARDLASEREYQARIEDERQSRLRSLEEARARAERAQAEAERVKLEADRARAEAERAKAEADRARIEADAAARKANEERMRREQASKEAEAQRREAETQRKEAEKAIRQAETARQERDAAMQKLYVSLSEILDTKRETRGFIVNLGDVLFDTGKATLKSEAREKLSRLAGILLAYPGTLTLEIEGHTDSTGSDELNNRLSQSRAESVRDYLVGAGVKNERIRSVRGMGKTKPIATNETAAGRQLNRRVEIVIDDSDQSR